MESKYSCSLNCEIDVYRGLLIPFALSMLVACIQGTNHSADCSVTSDADQDGINECEEIDLGTHPEIADTNGDGISDGDEIDCVSDPNDPNEQCYACGWPHNDPGDLVSEGAAVGDTMANISLTDQCGEQVDLWDFYGEYHILYVTAAW